jgi:hypothetical protein
VRRIANRIPQTIVTARKTKATMVAKNHGNPGQTVSIVPPYSSSMLVAFEIASTTAARITDIRKTVERGKRSSGRISILPNGMQS